MAEEIDSRIKRHSFYKTNFLVPFHLPKYYHDRSLSFLLYKIIIRDVVCARRLLKAAEELHLPKKVKREFGGGQKEFLLHESSCFEGIDDERTFFTTQERGWLVLNLLQTLRAGPGDEVAGLRLIEGQAIGECS
jgi:hypothetical protein